MTTALAAVAVVSMGCATVEPGQRGLVVSFGELSQEIYEPGPVLFNPFFQDVVSLPVRTTNVEASLSLPSREGLTIEAEISILYKIRPDMVRKVLEEIGPNYERSVILTTFRSSAANVSSKHNAKDMHSGERAAIEKEITERMNDSLLGRGFMIETVLLKSIVLPVTLARAIEEKLAAEQQAQRMQFVLQRERQEAERLTTQAAGIRDAQRIVNEGLTPLLIQYKSLEAFEALARSPNAKVIITDGTAPFLVQGEAAEHAKGAQ
jgi:regulator of protease activity HflC (stomatin/prohibitin superfamily)